jgi:alanine racemase
MSLKDPLQVIQLSRAAIRANINALAKLAGARMLAASVKANAYGHGLAHFVGELAAHKSVHYLAVHSIDEAVDARAAGWERKIMLLGPVADDRIPELFEHSIEPAIFDLQTLKAVGAASKKFKRSLHTHLKLETGTNRQGISDSEIDQFAEVYKRFGQLARPYGASMHFANIEDTTRHDFAENQLEEFRRLLALLTKAGIKPTIRHTACSAALILFEKTRFELVRPGISLYGYWPSKETYLSYRLAGGDNDIFKPVLNWRARITQIKKLPADAFVGYGCTYRTTAPTRLAVIPVGYFDGYPRSLSNRSYVLIRGRRAPVRGRVCMNLIMVDITDIRNVRVGDWATLLGDDGSERLTADTLADWAGTIHYEILSRLSPAIPREMTA